MILTVMKHTLALATPLACLCLCTTTQAVPVTTTPLPIHLPAEAPVPVRAVQGRIYSAALKQAHYLLGTVHPWKEDAALRLLTESRSGEESPVSTRTPILPRCGLASSKA